MWKEVLSSFLSVYTLLYHSLVPCLEPEMLPVNAIDRQKYLGTWYFKAAVSQREADIHRFRALDNILFTMEEQANNTLLLTGHMRMGDNCISQTWIYHINVEMNDLELEGRPQRKNLLWSGKWANCSECIVFQETEPPLDTKDGKDSLHRHMLYARSSDNSEMVTAFLKNAACHNMRANVTPRQEKEFCS